MTKVNKNAYKYYLNCAIGLLIMFGLGFIPGPAPITKMGMQLLGIFFGLLYLWSTCDLLWPSMAGFIALAIMGIGNADAITKLSFGNSQVMQMVFITAVVLACEEAGIFAYLINWMLKRKALNGHPWVLTGVFLFSAFVLSALSSSIPVIFMLWAMLYKIFDAVDLKKGHWYVSLMLFGIVFAACCGSSVFPFKDTALIFIAAYTNMSGVTVPYISYIVLMFTVGSVAILLYLAAMRFLFRVDISSLQEISTSSFTNDLPPMNKTQKFLTVYALLLVFVLASPVLANFSQAPWALSMRSLGMVGMSWILFALLILLRVDGKPLLNFSQLVNKIPWDLIFLLGAALAVSGLLTGEGTGVKEFVAGIIQPLFQGRSEFVFLMLICLVTLILTNLANNAVVAFMMLTITYIFSTQFTINQALAVSFINLTCIIAFLIPASSMFGAMLYANTAWIATKHIWKMAVLVVIIVFAVLLTIGIPLGRLLYPAV